MLKEKISNLLNEINELKDEIKTLKQYKQNIVARSRKGLEKLKTENPEKLKEYWRTAIHRLSFQ